jgi:hypothetical protein
MKAINAPVWKSELIQIEEMKKKKKKKKKKKGKGRPKITLVEVAKEEISIKVVTKSMFLDRIERLRRIHVVDPD